MSYNEKIALRASADLSAKKGLAMAIGGDVAGTVLTAVGVLDNKPESGEDASVTFSGRARVKAGGALAAGGRFTVAASGYFTAVTSGPSCGVALSAVASGGVTEAIVNFAALNLAGG